LTVTTFFSDSKLSTEIGSIILILPMSLFMALYKNHLALL
jgi:hypothetical protein